MNILKVLFAGFLCFGTFYSGITDAEKDGGSLLAIYNDLSILSRVTNAIALQSGSIQKTLNIRDVITELLKAHTKSFTELIEYDSDKMIPAIKYIADTGSKVFENSESLEDVKILVESLQKALSMNIPNPSELQKTLDDVKKVSFKDSAMTCKSEDVTRILKFVKGANVKDIRDLKNHLNSVKSCLDSIKNYEEKKFPELEILKNLQYSRENVTYFHKNSKKFSIFSNEISAVKTLFSKAESIWKTQKPSGIYPKIVKIGHLIDEITDHERTPKPALCAGFPGEDDVAKVSEDVKSEWFQKNVARGTNTDNLEKSLEPFIKFGRKMKALRENWKKFHDIFSHQNEFVHWMSDKLKSIEEYGGLDKGMQLLTDSERIFKTSWTNPTNLDEAKLTPFDPQLKTITSTVTHIESIQNWCQTMVESYDFETLHHVLDGIEALDLESHSTVKELQEDVNRVAHYDTLHSFFEEFQQFSGYQKSLEKLFGEIDAIKSVEFSQIVPLLGGSEIMMNLRKLETNKFNVAGLQGLVQFLEDLRKYKDNYPKFENFFKSFAAMEKDLHTVENFVKKLGNPHSQIVLNFMNSMDLSTKFGRGMHVFRDIAFAYSLRNELKASTEYASEVNDVIKHHNPHREVADFWGGDRKKAIEKLIQELTTFENSTKDFVSGDLMTLRGALKAAIRVQGLRGFGHGYHDITHLLEDIHQKNPKLFTQDFQDALKNSEILHDLDLDFASHKGFIHAASLSIDDIKGQFDEMFGLNSRGKTIKHAFLAVIGIAIGALLLLIIAGLLIFGLTEKGRTKYKNLYIFYFGKPHHFEKRWRYSLFMDRQDGKNALLDAVREINPPNVLKEVKRGAFINGFSLYGNTSLHLATKRGYSEIVEILIKNGADRSLLNAQNKIPEQMIPEKYQETFPDKVERYEKIEKIYKKYKNKKFRIRVPEVFPSSSFHIYVDDKLEVELVNAFMLQYKAIVTPTLIPTTTHYIVKTDAEGILELETVDLLFWVMSGVIIVKDSWINDCLKDEKLIEKDALYLVEKVKFKGTVYSTVTQWTEAMAKSTMPFLYGVYVAVVMAECPNLIPLSAIISNHGGVVCETFPDKEQFNLGTHPYMHSNLGPFFLIHDGKTDLSFYKNDADKMYTLFTEDEFIHFLLARTSSIDLTPDLKQVSNELED